MIGIRSEGDAPKRYVFPEVFGTEVFDLAKINEAMDTYFGNAQSESATRYNLVHQHGWAATDAVIYTLCAVFLIDSQIDPNRPSELAGIAEEVVGG